MAGVIDPSAPLGYGGPQQVRPGAGPGAPAGGPARPPGAPPGPL